MSKESQIFQTSSEKRWQSAKWSFRFFLFLLLISLVVVGIGIVVTNKSDYDIPLESRAMKKVLNGKVPNYRDSKLSKEYRGFRELIDDKWARGKGVGQNNKPINLSNSPFFNDSIGIRAGFFVNWDAQQSISSLERNISKLNLVIPEWLFINPETDRLYSDINPLALKIMQTAGVKVMPLLTNNYKSVFRGDAVKRIITNPLKKQQLINDIVSILKANNFVGVNIDFEDLELETDEPLVAFQKNLYEVLHAQNFLVTQDVIPFNDDYNFKALSAYNDYLILMAYDEFHLETKPGPVSSQKWIQAAVDNITSQVPAQKVILAMAAYGYDWKFNGKKVSKVESLTYQQALANARDSEAEIDFDDETYNLHFQYYDDDDSLHEVHFVDAATNFNTLRFATESNLAGTVIWRLGGEDVRLWDFYDKPMAVEALESFNFQDFNKIEAGIAPDFSGDGEILDIIATPKDGKITSEVDRESMLITEETYDTLPSTYVIKKFGGVKQKKIVLTYDDGPDPKYTRQILDTLAKYHVPATFFVVGIEAENNIPLVKRIYREGHEIGNHTFTHPNIAQVSKKRAVLELDATRLLIECITGHSTILFRAPFNADSEPGKYEELAPVAMSREKNYVTVGESIDPEDWQVGEIEGFNADSIFNRTVNIYERRVNSNDPEDTTINGSIILLHDAGGDRKPTVEATGRIIRFFQSKGYTFTTVADLLGKKPDDVMPPVPKDKGYYWIQFNYFLALAGYYGSNIFTALFITFLILSAIRLLLMGIMAAKQKRKEKLLAASVLASPVNNQNTLVSIIVPAYNEEVNAVKSLENLLKCDYPLFEIIFVDDGSKDDTYNKVLEAFQNNPLVKVFTKPNGGKASALNYGILQSNANYVVCIDADTKLATDAVSKLMQHFLMPLSSGKEVGAVAGVVKVGNEVNMLTKWQSIEYITSQNFDRKGFAYANAITVVPGAIGGFKRQAIIDAGGFTTDTLAEDCDITIRILKAGYQVENEPQAVAYTEAPETLKQFMKQRNRWSFGVMQTFWKHRIMLFNNNYKNIGFVALPDMLLFKYIIPFFTPFADLLMLIGLFTGNAGKIGFYYLIFMIIDAAIAAVAFGYEKENPSKLLWLIPQRLVYRWLMMVVLFKAFKRAIKGELQHWGVLKRTGNVNVEMQ